MKVFFFEPYTLAIPHFETALELMQLHLNQGDDVYLFHCNANLNSCEANPTHDLLACFKCISRRKNGISLVEGKEKIKNHNFINLSSEEKEIIEKWHVSFKDIDELKTYQYENIDIGMAVASSLISFHRDSNPDLVKESGLVTRLFKASLKVYFSFKRIFQNNRPELVYIFNARFSNIRPVIRLCELNNISYKVHERGANKNKYSLSENHFPHDLKNFQKNIESEWAMNVDKSIPVKTATDFYSGRRGGKEQSWHSFVKDQNENELPENWNSAHRNIVIFNSSEDEFAAIGDDFKMDLFENQLEGLKYIADELKHRNNISVYLRIHPNLAGVNNESVKRIYDIKTDNFHIIDPSSTISSYRLMDLSKVVVTFGSTAGIEATFWGKPSILIGKSFYNALDVTYNPKTREDLNELLFNVSEPKDKTGTYKYGYYLNNHGIDFKFYKAEGLFEGKFNGTRIHPATWITKYAQSSIINKIMRPVSRIHAEKY